MPASTATISAGGGTPSVEIIVGHAHFAMFLAGLALKGITEAAGGQAVPPVPLTSTTLPQTLETGNAASAGSSSLNTISKSGS